MFRPCFQHLGEIERKRIAMPDNVVMRLNRLEKPEPWPSELLAEIMGSFDAATLQQYPAYQPFYERLAAFTGCRADEIVVGAGIEEHIRNLFMLCVEPGDKVAILYPTCAMFEIYARAFGAELVKIVVDPADGLTFAHLAAQLPDDLKLLLLANPGQPVESVFSEGSINVLAELCRERGAVLAVDEAYHGFGAPTMIGLRGRHDNLVVLRTFSKAFGAASIRLGYAVAGPTIIKALDAVRQSGEVSAFSMHVASVLMANFDRYVQPGIDAICEARDGLRDRVGAELGLRAWGRFANHVLIAFEHKYDRDVVRYELSQKGILTKANFPAPLDRHMLVTCGSPALMQRFFDEMKAAL